MEQVTSSSIKSKRQRMLNVISSYKWFLRLCVLRIKQSASMFSYEFDTYQPQTLKLSNNINPIGRNEDYKYDSRLVSIILSHNINPNGRNEGYQYDSRSVSIIVLGAIIKTKTLGHYFSNIVKLPCQIGLTLLLHFNVCG